MTEKILIRPWERKREDYDGFRWSLNERGKTLLQRINEKMIGDSYRFRFDTCNVYGYKGNFDGILAIADTSILDDPLSAKKMYLELSGNSNNRHRNPRIEADIDLVNGIMTTRSTVDKQEIRSWHYQPLGKSDVDCFFDLASDFGGYYLARLRRSIDGFAELNKLIK